MPYLDDNKEFYDYGTDEVNANDVIDTHKTGVPFYNDFLNEKGRQYLADEHNLKGEIVYMTPQEYYDNCGKYGFYHTVDPDALKRQRAADKKTIEHLKQVLTVYKKKFPLPFLNIAEHGQEGLHRFYVIGELFGWDSHKYPVLVITHADEERAKRAAKQKIINNAVSVIRRAVNNALGFTYSSIEDFKEQLEWELSRELDGNENVFAEWRDSMSSDTDYKLEDNGDYYTVSIGEAEYSFDKEELKLKDASDEDIDELDEIESLDMSDEELDDFLARYFDDDWIVKNADKIEKMRKNESFESSTQNSLIEVLEEVSNCFYESTEMALDITCEKLKYRFGIDANYRGRSIYIDGKKVATLKVELDSPKMLGVYGYKLFI